MTVQSTSELPQNLIDSASKHSPDVVDDRWQLFQKIDTSLGTHSSDISDLQTQLAELQAAVTKLQGS